MKLYISEYVTYLVSAFSRKTWKELKSVTDEIRHLSFNELVKVFDIEKIESTENIYAFRYSNLNICVAYWKDTDTIVLVDIFKKHEFLDHNNSIQNNNIFGDDWVRAAAYFIAEKNGFTKNPIDDWNKAKHEVAEFKKQLIK